MTLLQYLTLATRAPAHAADSPCVPVLLCWNRLQQWGAPHYMRAQGYNVSDSNTTHVLPTLQHQVQCNPTSTQYSTQNQQTPPWRIFSTTLNFCPCVKLPC